MSPNTKPIPQWCEDILTDRPTGHLCTLRPDGRLSVNPVCVLWDGQYVRVSTLKSRQKYKNLLRDPRVAISIPHRNNPNRYIEISGTAELTDDSDRTFVNRVARTYMGVDEYPFDRPGDERAVITIHAEKVFAPQIPLADTPPTAPETERNKQLARNFIDAINRQDFAAIADAYAEDGICWTPGSMPISGTFTRDQIAEGSKQILTAFPEGLTITIKRLTAEEDRVAIEAESHGRHISGKTYHNQYHFLMRLRGGKIIEWREYMDTMHANDVLCGGRR
jgi:uncharacterized protein